MAKKVMKRPREEVENKGLKLSVIENGKEGQSKMIASRSFLEEELASLQQGRRSDDGRDSVETLGVGLRTRVKR